MWCRELTHDIMASHSKKFSSDLGPVQYHYINTLCMRTINTPATMPSGEFNVSSVDIEYKGVL